MLELTLTMGRRTGPRCSRRGADITLQPVHLDELERQMKVAVIILNPTFLVFVQFVGRLESVIVGASGFAATPAGAAVGGEQFCFNHEFPGIFTPPKIGLNYRFDSYWR
jgi:hypothetical protein